MQGKEEKYEVFESAKHYYNSIDLTLIKLPLLQ